MSKLSSQSRNKLFFDMVRIRMVEEALVNHYPKQEMRCPVHLSIGQEAVAVGVCSALNNEDYVMSTHRAHAHYLAKGGSLKAMLAEIYGKATGCSAGMGGSMHLVDLNVNMLGSTPIVGSSLPVAVGVAFGAWMKEEKKVTTIFFGEGTTEEGVFLEGLNFAALKKLPIIFVCENNLYSVYSPMNVRQSQERDRVAIAKAHGIPGVCDDGNRVEQVYTQMQTAVEYTRGGRGPYFLEFATYRWREHCGVNYDNDIGYRTEEEFLQWKEQCPIENYKRQLIEDKILNEVEIAEKVEAIQKEIEEAFLFAKESSFPEWNQLNQFVYA